MIRKGTDLNTRKDVRMKKRIEAEERQAVSVALSGPERQLAILDKRLGKGVGAWKERNKLQMLIDAK